VNILPWAGTALALLLLALAVWIIAVRSTFAAVVGFVAYGIILSLVWMRLQAPDIALTEVAIGSGLTGVLLLGAGSRLRITEGNENAHAPGVVVRVLAALLCAVVTVGLAIAVLLLPDPAPSLAPLVAANLAHTELGNPVTAVLIAFRATDTMLEVVVLLLALAGAWSLAPDRLWGGYPGLRHHADPDGMLVYAARRLPPLGIIVALYLFYAGADGPGGEFQSATVLAAMWLLGMLAGVTHAPPTGDRRVRALLVMGSTVFLVVGITGMFTAGAFLAYPAGWAKVFILTIEVPVTLSLAVLLGMLMAGAPERPVQP
jgi:multisubunit Na+/H+ antiporter MnhB subunit